MILLICTVAAAAATYAVYSLARKTCRWWVFLTFGAPVGVCLAIGAGFDLYSATFFGAILGALALLLNAGCARICALWREHRLARLMDVGVYIVFFGIPALLVGLFSESLGKLWYSLPALVINCVIAAGFLLPAVGITMATAKWRHGIALSLPLVLAVLAVCFGAGFFGVNDHSLAPVVDLFPLVRIGATAYVTEFIVHTLDHFGWLFAATLLCRPFMKLKYGPLIAAAALTVIAAGLTLAGIMGVS